MTQMLLWVVPFSVSTVVPFSVDTHTVAWDWTGKLRWMCWPSVPPKGGLVMMTSNLSDGLRMSSSNEFLRTTLGAATPCSTMFISPSRAGMAFFSCP